MVILIKMFGKPRKFADDTIAERNEFARNHRIIADQTNFNEGFLVIFSFYEEEKLQDILPKQVIMATVKQKNYLKSLNIEFAEDISKEHASALIEKAKGAK
jgi:hypothetical protein